MEIEEKIHKTSDGDAHYYTITNAAGAQVVLSSIGAGIVSVRVPDPEGNIDDVVLGYKEAESYLGDGPESGKVPGRFANRIALGKFTLDGKEYDLAINNGPNHLHGGPTGFHNRIWESEALPEGNGVKFTYHSADGEEGYPGNLTVNATYTWSDDNVLTLRFTATTDAPTIANFTNHVYFNLNGHADGSALDHELLVNSFYYLPTDKDLIPTGDLAYVKGTPMDFTEPKKLGQDIKADFPALNYGKGYDANYLVNGYVRDGKPRFAAMLKSDKSGRRLFVNTTFPDLIVYTGNWIGGSPESKAGHFYKDYDGVALECQYFPDSPNKPCFPSVELRPGETFDETIEYIFR